MVDEGYAATQILSQLHESVIEEDLSDRQKSAITEKMAVSDSAGAPSVHNRNIRNVIATPQLFESCTMSRMIRFTYPIINDPLTDEP